MRVASRRVDLGRPLSAGWLARWVVLSPWRGLCGPRGGTARPVPRVEVGVMHRGWTVAGNPMAAAGRAVGPAVVAVGPVGWRLARHGTVVAEARSRHGRGRGWGRHVVVAVRLSWVVAQARDLAG